MRQRKISHGAEVPAKPRVEGQSFVVTVGICNWKDFRVSACLVKLNCVGCGHGSGIIKCSGGEGH